MDNKYTIEYMEGRLRSHEPDIEITGDEGGWVIQFDCLDNDWGPSEWGATYSGPILRGVLEEAYYGAFES